MSKVFIGGSRRVSRLAASVRARLDSIVSQGLPVVIGDANGADKAVQQYLFAKKYRNVEVFCSGSLCRNNVGGWPARHIGVDSRETGSRFYAAKDRAMAHEAVYGLMVWDGKSTGTLLNVLRLLRQRKMVLVYSVPDQRFSELAGYEHWPDFMVPYGQGLRSEAEERAAHEERADSQRQQRDLFQLDRV